MFFNYIILSDVGEHTFDIAPRFSSGDNNHLIIRYITNRSDWLANKRYFIYLNWSIVFMLVKYI